MGFPHQRRADTQSRGLEARGVNTGKSTSSPFSPALRSGERSCHWGLQWMGGERKQIPGTLIEHLYFLSEAWQSQPGEISISTLLRETNDLKVLPSSSWDGNSQILPPRDASTPQLRPGVQRSIPQVHSTRASRQHRCSSPCTLPRLISETPAPTYSHLQRDIFVPFLLAF